MLSLITEHLDVWTTAEQPAKTGGRGRAANGNKSPYGIQKLRELILELAVRGKLVPQDPDDEPASELLKKIAAEKARLIKEGNIKKQKPLPPIAEEEKPFDLPAGWEWTRLGTLFNSITSGGTPSKRNPAYWNGAIPWASVKDLGGNRFIHETQDHITREGLEAGSKLADPGDILVCTRMGLGKIAIVGVSMAFNQDIKAIKLTSGVDVDFFLNSYMTLKLKGKGTTVEGIKQEQLMHIVIGLPPKPEQHRIVAKVDELMALCDRLEQEQAESGKAHQTLVETLLGTLTQAKSNQELAEAWRRIAGHFDILFTTEQSIDQLKQTILQLAVMGKLVPQDPNDEPASELLKKIAAEKARLIKAKAIRKTKKPVAFGGDVLPIPDNWAYSTLYDLGEIGPRIDAPDETEASFVPMTMISEKYGVRVQSETRKWGEIKSGFTHFGEGDVVLAKITPCFQNGKSCVMRGLKNGIGAGTTELHVFRPIGGFVHPEYVLLFLKSPSFIQDGIPKMTGSAGQKRITRDYFAGKPFPLPPLEEQHRIVAKVDELMALCDALKARLGEAQATRVHLADAIVEQAVAN